MFSPDDTIVAVATAAGRGGIGVVRLSGPQAHDIAARLVARAAPLEARRATFARFQPADTPAHAPRDEVVVTWFPAPRSYTGQHVVEISAHGSPVVLDAIVRAAIGAGARLARPGEFTLRAFLNGKRDLVQAEAVADLIAAATPLQARVACDQLDGTLSGRITAIEQGIFDLVVQLEASLDFPDEGYHFVQPGEIASRLEQMVADVDTLLADATRGRLIRDGATVVVAGRPNVGKSSLFNALAGADRAIVTGVAGTTRDLIAERIDIGGLAVTLVDTAGARETDDEIERAGVARAEQARAGADLVLVVLDGSECVANEDRRLLESTARRARVVVVNKCDRPRAAHASGEWRDIDAASCRVSALTGDGLAALREAIVRALAAAEPLHDNAAVSNTRHIGLLRQSRAHLTAARDAAAAAGTPEECVLVDLHAARACFDEILGARTSDDVLEQVFARFCIGK